MFVLFVSQHSCERVQKVKKTSVELLQLQVGASSLISNRLVQIKGFSFVILSPFSPFGFLLL